MAGSRYLLCETKKMQFHYALLVAVVLMCFLALASAQGDTESFCVEIPAEISNAIKQFQTLLSIFSGK
ncbi:hypothetical protein JTE90_023565 [Oedothorax gibbosus]|uniref:Uncharacterized protein n=1 Tax=Oedothorax gibbosus TaxID=931172 RepID=A0AAV6UAN7_9ARAC|nr:hypothetical protein JTE90_023565 [Oedothorax gibbosus]